MKKDTNTMEEFFLANPDILSDLSMAADVAKEKGYVNLANVIKSCVDQINAGMEDEDEMTEEEKECCTLAGINLRIKRDIVLAKKAGLYLCSSLDFRWDSFTIILYEYTNGTMGDSIFHCKMEKVFAPGKMKKIAALFAGAEQAIQNYNNSSIARKEQKVSELKAQLAALNNEIKKSKKR